MNRRTLALIAAALLIAALVLLTSYSLLPAAPVAPTPTWPQGIELPNKLPRIP